MSSEQASGVGQVHEAVTQLDSTTQQNAALVEQSAAAADSMRDEAKRLALTGAPEGALVLAETQTAGRDSL